MQNAPTVDKITCLREITFNVLQKTTKMSLKMHSINVCQLTKKITQQYNLYTSPNNITF